MIFAKIFTHTLFFCALLIPFTPLKAVRSIIQIDSLEEARKQITALPAGSKPGCVIDFHGVTVEQTSHNGMDWWLCYRNLNPRGIFES